MRSRSLKNSKHEFYALTFPTNLTTEQSADFWNSVASTFGGSRLLPAHQETVVVELRSDMRGLTHRLGIPWQHSALLDKLRSHVPGIHTDDMPLTEQPKWSRAYEVGLSDRTRLLDVERVQSVTRSILTAMAHDVKDGDHIAMQLVINPIGRMKQVSETHHERSSRVSPIDMLRGSSAGRDEIKERRAKLEESQFKVVLRFVAASSTDVRAEWLLNNVKKSYHELNSSSAYLTKQWTKRAKVIDRFNGATAPVLYPAQVSVTELTALTAWPIGSPQVGGLTLGKTRYLPPNETILKDGRRLGLSYQDRPIAISADDGCRHMYVIGPSGLGKTTLLANTLQQDIERGYGAIVMESKGDLYEAALNAVPRERVDDVVVIDLTDHDWPVGLNLLHEGDPRVVVDDLIRLFMNNASDAVYLPEMLYHGFHTLRHFPELTVIDLLPFLQPRTPIEKAWRDGLINRLPKGGEFQTYWKTFDQLKPPEQRQRIQPVASRMWELTNRRDVRNMLGQSKSTIDLKSIMRDNKLLFIYIPDSIGDKTVSLLASLLVSSLWDAVRAVKTEKTKPTYLYMDEVQKFLNLPIDLAEMLSLARSYKFGLVMAHQYRSQLTPQLQSAITNAATMVSFKLDGQDANWMQTMMGKAVSPEDFMGLNAYEVIARVATAGGSSAPTFFKTLSPQEPHGLGRLVIERSRVQFSTQAELVDQSILARRMAPTEPVKARPSFGFVDKE